MEESLFCVVVCKSCGKWTIVEEVKEDSEEDVDGNPRGQCPWCGVWGRDVEWRFFCFSDIDGIDDGPLFNIWMAISKYIQDAAREDSLTDPQRTKMTGLAEKVLEAFAEAPSSAVSRASEYAGGNEEFAAWLEEVDRIVQDKVPLSVFCLEDMPFFDCFEAGDSPEDFVAETVAQTIRDNYGDEYAELLEG